LGHHAGEAAGGAGEISAERVDERLEVGVAEKAMGHKGDESGHDQADPTGEVGGEGLDRGRDGFGRHG
jgi:hypothetical protein